MKNDQILKKKDQILKKKVQKNQMKKDQVQKGQVWKYQIQKYQAQKMVFRRTRFRRYLTILLYLSDIQYHKLPYLQNQIFGGVNSYSSKARADSY